MSAGRQTRSRPTTMPGVVCIALALVLTSAPPALALDAYWQGQRSVLWGDGVKDGKSNWYDKAPFNGSPVGVPDRAATFVPIVSEQDIFVHGRHSIRSIVFDPETDPSSKLVKINIGVVSGGKSSLIIRGKGLSNKSSIEPQFHVGKKGKLIFKRHSSGGLFGVGSSIAIFNSSGGTTSFEDRSSADDLRIFNNDRGRLVFKDNCSVNAAEIINNGSGALVSIEDKCSVQSVILDNINGKVTFDDSKISDHNFDNITNQGKIVFGRKVISTTQKFLMLPSSSIVFYLPSPEKSGEVEAFGHVHLDGEIVIYGSGKWPDGTEYPVIIGKSMTGKFDKVKFASFPKSVIPKLVYKKKKVLVKIHRID